MKKTLPTLILLAASIAASAQQYHAGKNLQVVSQPQEIATEARIQINDPAASFQKPQMHSGERNSVTVITIGSAANAYFLSGKPRTLLWADNNLNAITFLHRLSGSPGSGFLGYDLSTDGGSTWATNIPILTSPVYAPKPVGAIYNPEGNSDPGQAYLTYFIPSTAGTYITGVHKLDQSQNPTQNTWSGYYNANHGFTIQPLSGDVFAVAAAMDGFNYMDCLVVSHGVFNPAINDYEYSQSLIPFPAHPQGSQYQPADVRIAFAPDGLTGFISVIWDNMTDTHAGGKAYYPILMKTTDGGITWGNPMPFQIGGPDGFSEVKNYLSDEQLEEIFGLPLPHRDSIIYTTAYEHGLALDMNGNPHISVTIGIADINAPYTIIAGDGYSATFHFYTLSKGQCRIARYVSGNKTFQGTFGGISEFNRSQISATQDGSKVFLSWLDTDFEGVTSNIMPDIFCNAYDVMTRKYTSVYNVSNGSEAWLESFMGTASHYVFETETGYVIPFVYQTMPGGDPTNPVDFKYIADFTLSGADFIYGPDCGIPGDSNGDGIVNVRDLVSIIQWSLGLGPGLPFHFCNADVNGDGMVCIHDAILVIMIILGDWP
ncbi:MAG TPA: hypothetical protein ENN08_06520 [Bacteroidales bacterium]|nr:hypothetical protein [Bacteroidales bacterium]